MNPVQVSNFKKYGDHSIHQIFSDFSAALSFIHSFTHSYFSLVVFLISSIIYLLVGQYSILSGPKIDQIFKNLFKRPNSWCYPIYLSGSGMLEISYMILFFGSYEILHFRSIIICRFYILCPDRTLNKSKIFGLLVYYEII